ncbi:TetR/AcrR family transcriptional regulator [Glaciihabitans arcticus]|uniref:TetR/AcrR family transcriptional regulator n=1 Tax=Glaciihabitans arcticus TaxID=2668039 RepID=A0A4Q9GT84_9MICO|nr:TetR/AcrR family transcriptional regulator [Glaciihabitans arcticus]TBN57921.1 TetR/AcrR family transcriptional regulator [Glaciihabitans arcticus]
MVTTGERQRNARGEGARLRLEIVAATQALLADGETATLRSIARRAGISAPSIYRHFPDVDAVMSAVADDAFDELVDALVQKRDRHTDPVARLWAISDGYLDFARDRPHIYRVMFGGVWNAAAALELHPGEDAHFREMGMNAFRLLVAAIQACVDDGTSSSTDPRRDAAALWAGLHGLAQLLVTAPLFDWPAETDRAVVRSLARLKA